ncbi:MAG: Rieske 2Fe-2S domain-containing protein [Acidimicrobiia bacterium]|nr:Rieske 2Fe-2S domain-containing protein [Acidimicrobiia bacterium]
MTMPEASLRWVDVGSLAELQAEGRLLGKVDAVPVLVVWSDGRAWAIEDRCPHLGFPLHRGSWESGLVTCHWHHARFDLTSGCTLDPWADDAHGFEVRTTGGRVAVAARPDPDPVATLRARLERGLADDLTLVVAKSVLGLVEAGEPTEDIVAVGLAFGLANRRAGWGAGLTVLVAMANLVGRLEPRDDVRALALTHGLRFVADDTAGHPPRFAEPPLRPAPDRALLEAWFRRFVETRSAPAAERVLASALDAPDGLAWAERMLFAAVTDHLFVDEGHTLDFANKACEAGALAGPSALTSVVAQAAAAQRSEERSAWRHPVDLVVAAGEASARLLAALRVDAGLDLGSNVVAAGPGVGGERVEALAWKLLDERAAVGLDALCREAEEGATPEELARAVVLAAGLRIVRFHTQNEQGDWDEVHHSFTHANALHRALQRQPTGALCRGLVAAALRVHLDRFLNIPAARLPAGGVGDLRALAACWERQGGVDEAGTIAAAHVRGGASPHELAHALLEALLDEDAGFHWYQLTEAMLGQALDWPAGSEPQALLFAGLARFLAAHTPTRRETRSVFDVARRLRRGEELFAVDG